MNHKKKHVFKFGGKRLSFKPSSIEIPPLDNDSGGIQISSLALDISGECNLNCLYCAEQETLPQRNPMSPETINRAVDFLVSQSDPQAPLSIHLGSGEPMLKADLVQACGVRARQSEREISLHLTTNGTLLNHKILDWLISDGWNIKLSLDGDKDHHDRFRKDKGGQRTYDIIEPSLLRLLKEAY